MSTKDFTEIDVPYIDCYNPATGAHIGTVMKSTAAEVERARADLRQAKPLWAGRPLSERIRILQTLQMVIIDSLDEIVTVINKDSGKSKQDALIELFITVDVLQRSLKKASKWLRREWVSPGLYLTKLTYTEQRPYGTVAVISPWNYPFLLAMQPVLMALLAGNTVMLKPSEVTAKVGVIMEKLFMRVPELAPFVRVLHGDGAVGAAVVASRPDLIYLTGSTQTGKKIASAAAEHLIPTIFELGGKDPMIVLADADVNSAARWCAWGATTNAGQVCASVERVYVVDDVYEPFVEQLVAEVDKLNVGHSDEIRDPHHYGPLANQRQAEIVDEHIADAVARGARLLRGGVRDGLLMQPTLLIDVDDSMRVMREETFGPVIPVARVRDEDEAVAKANSGDYGLSAYVWGGLAHARQIMQRLEAGSLVANDVISNFAIPSLPFGGVKQSGNGRSHGKHDLAQFTQTIAYTISVPPLPFDIATRLREPGNYRLGEAILKMSFGVTARQRLEPIEMLLKSQRTRRLFGGVTEKLNHVLSTVTDTIDSVASQKGV